MFCHFEPISGTCSFHGPMMENQRKSNKDLYQTTISLTEAIFNQVLNTFNKGKPLYFWRLKVMNLGPTWKLTVSQNFPITDPVLSHFYGNNLPFLNLSQAVFMDQWWTIGETEMKTYATSEYRLIEGKELTVKQVLNNVHKQDGSQTKRLAT